MSDTETIAADESAHIKIELRAYQIWEDEGFPTGCELDHWLRAESEIAAAESLPVPAAGDGSGSKKKR